MRRIRTRMLAAVLLAAVVPAVPASLLVRNLLERSMNSDLQTKVAQGLNSGMVESRLLLQGHKVRFSRAADRYIETGRLSVGDSTPVVVLDAQGAVLETSSTNLVPPVLGADLDSIPQVVSGWLAVRCARSDGRPLIITQPLPPGSAERAGALAEALRLTSAFQLDRESILRSLILPFVLVYAVLALLAVVLAMTTTRRLVGTLEEVSRAAGRVASGDLTTRVEPGGSGEAGQMAEDFNEMVTNLADQRRQLARLEKLAAWRGMARTLAHEIKNPLTPILLAVQQAANSYKGSDSNHREVLNECETIVQEEVESLRSLVRSFSDFARLPAPQLRSSDLIAIVQDLGRLYGERMKLKLPGEPVFMDLDPGQLRRALVNLVDNGLAACRRAARPEEVEVAVLPRTTEIEITVTDRGEGITPENLPLIFEPDFTTEGEGMGLGLPIVAGIVSGHRGRIDVASRPAEGAAFTIILPKTEEPPCPGS